jgi:transposase InsO family protein
MSTAQGYFIPRFSPLKKICEVPLKQVQQALLEAFTKSGRPQAIKVDNGRPMGDPQRETIPVLALWLIALGIKLILNRVRVPQDNAKVERMQGVLSNWTEWNKCANWEELQSRLDRQSSFHNSQYRVSRLGFKTRAEVYPHLLNNPNPFDPSDFDVQRAINFVSEGQWKREVSSQGQISHWGQRHYVGVKHAHKRLSIKLNAQTNQWESFDPNGAFIKAFDSFITKENLWRLNLS